MTWQKEGTETLTSAGTDITVSTLTGLTFYTSFNHGLFKTGESFTSPRIRLNELSTSIYTTRTSNDGGIEALAVSQTEMTISANNVSGDVFTVCYFTGISAEEKLLIGFSVLQFGGTGDTATQRTEMVGKAVITSDTLNAFTFKNLDTRDFDVDSNTSVLGTGLAIIPSPVIDDTNLKAYWRMNETSGPIVNVSQGAANLGSDADLAVSGSPSFNQTGSPSGLANNILWGATGSFGDAGTSFSQFNFMHNTSGLFTLCVWLKFPSAVVANQTLFDNSIVGDEEVGVSIVTRANQNFRLIVSNGVGNNPVINVNTSTNSIPTDNAFHFYVFRWDVSLGSNQFKFRRDDGNEELFSDTGDTPSNADAFKVTRIAANTIPQTGTAELDANVLELSIFNSIISAADETTLFASGNGVPIY